MEDYTIKIGTIEDWKKEDESVYKKILDKMLDINTDYDWYEYTISYYTEELEKIGFRDVKISFSGFCSQGDGANFTGSFYYKPGQVIPHSEIPSIDKLGHVLVKIGKNHEWGFNIKKGYGGYHYEHENTVSTFDAEFFHVGLQCRESIGEILEDEILTACRNIMQEIYSSLEKEYDYLTSEAAIVETCMANEYKFDQDGKIRG